MFDKKHDNTKDGMTYKIIRGALGGILLGMVIGFVIPSLVHFNTIKTVVTEEFSVDRKIEKALEEAQQENYIDNTNDTNALSSSVSIGAVSEEESENSGSVSTFSTEGEYEGDQSGLDSKLLRFHVRANSDSEEDIELKYLVRDAILQDVGDSLDKCTSRQQAVTFLQNHLAEIKECAENVIKENGKQYDVEVKIATEYFPARQYGELVVPAGNYQALKVNIGAAKGENFWCLLYPSVCIPSDAGAIVTKEGENEIRRALTEEEYDKLFIKKSVPKDKIEVRFKILEWIGL